MRYAVCMIGRIALYSIFTVSVLGLLVVFVVIQQASLFVNENLPALTVAPASLSTDTWAIFNPETGEVLEGSGEDEVRPIASITKLFTAGTVMESARKHDAFTLVYSDIATEGRSGKLFYGETYTPYQLLFPMLIESSNDAASAIGRELGGAFPFYISNTVKQLGLTETSIDEPTGLSPENVSTARELAKFYAHLKKTYPHILDITRLRVYINSHTGYVNNNPARELDSFTGGKNGYTPEAKRTFVGTFRKSDGTEVGIVLLGSSDVVPDITALLSTSRAPGM